MDFNTLRKFDRLAVNLLCLVPAGVLTVLFLNGSLDPNPIQVLERRTGDIALGLLLISLVFTPLRLLTGFNRGVKYRRITGLYAFYYAAGHFLLFLGLDYGFNFSYILPVLLNDRALWFGIAAFLILAVLAITSTDGWKVRLKKSWKKIHRFVYLASLLVLLHFATIKKGDLLRLSGEELYPFLGLLLWLILMILRLPVVKKWLSHQGREPSKL